MIVENSIIINLSSKNATLLNGTKLSNVLFETPSLLLKYENDLRYEFQMVSCEFPSTFYAINENNNLLYYQLGGLTYSIFVSFGNYNFNDFATELATQFLANGHTMVLTLSKKTGKGILTSTTNFTLLSTSTIKEVLGFSTTVTSASNVLNLPFPLNLLGIYKLKVFSKFLNLKSYDARGSCLCTVPVNIGSFGLITYNNNLGSKSLIRSDFINQVDIEITDELNNFVDFNNIHWSITFRINQIQKIPEIPKEKSE